MLERFWNFYNIHYYRNFHKVLATHFIYELDKLNIWNSFYTCFCWFSLKCTQHKNLRSKSTLTLQAPTLEKGQHSQTIRRLLPTNCSSVFDHFVGLAFKVLNKKEHRPCFANTMLLCILAQFFFCFDTKQNLSKHITKFNICQNLEHICETKNIFPNHSLWDVPYFDEAFVVLFYLSLLVKVSLPSVLTIIVFVVIVIVFVICRKLNQKYQISKFKWTPYN